MSSAEKWFDYDSVAHYYNELMRYIPYDGWAHYIIKMFYLHNGKGERFIDLGAGTCKLEFELARRGLNITGIDISADMLSEAQNTNESILFNMVNGDIRELPFKDNSFDCAICMYDTYNHLNAEGARRLMSECSRILKKGGMMMFDFNTSKGLKAFAEDDFIRKGNDFISYWHMDINDDNSFCTLKLSVKNILGVNVEMSFSERAVSGDEILRQSHNAGIQEVHLYEFMTEEPLSESTHRGFAVCIKA